MVEKCLISENAGIRLMPAFLQAYSLDIPRWLDFLRARPARAIAGGRARYKADSFSV